MINLSWEDFVQDFTKHNIQGEFLYMNKILILRSGTKRSIFSIEHLGKIIHEQFFKTPKELLENVRIEGKSLQEIWNDLQWDE